MDRKVIERQKDTPERKRGEGKRGGKQGKGITELSGETEKEKKQKEGRKGKRKNKEESGETRRKANEERKGERREC